MDPDNTITIAWWNTGMVPPRGDDRGTPENAIAVASTVRRLLHLHADIVCLGEVSPEFLSLVKAELAIGNLRSRDLLARRLGLLYRAERCEFASGRHVEAQFGTSASHAAWRFRVKIEDSVLGLWIVHWSSPLAPDGAQRRLEAARSVAESVDAQVGLSGSIVIGDFNEEPFDENVTWHLRGSRERRQVVEHRARFYNPFWRHQGESSLLEVAAPLISRGPGTIELTSFQSHLTHWRLVDFALVDKSLVTGEQGWRLAEGRTGIVVIERRSDHLPVMISLDKLAEQT